MECPNIWAEIDLTAIDHNVRELRRITARGARLMAVVKADGYGHGAVEVARTALAAGADMLAVARVDEGVALRKAGLQAPILVFGPTFHAFAEALIENDLIQSVTGLAAAEPLDAVARRLGRTLPIHLKAKSALARYMADVLANFGDPENGQSCCRRRHHGLARRLARERPRGDESENGTGERRGDGRLEGVVQVGCLHRKNGGVRQAGGL